MSSYPCKYFSTRKCCCCFNCDPRQVFLILSSTCLLLGLINMCSYPLCPAIIISSLVLAFYYFGSGIFLLYAITGVHQKLLRTFPWLMFFSYIPIAGYVGCLLSSLECIDKWTMHYTIDEDQDYARNMFIGIVCLYSMFAVVDFLFSTYAMMLSIGQNEAKPEPQPPSQSFPGHFGSAPNPLAYSAMVSATTPNVEDIIMDDDDDDEEDEELEDTVALKEKETEPVDTAIKTTTTTTNTTTTADVEEQV